MRYTGSIVRAIARWSSFCESILGRRRRSTSACVFLFVRSFVRSFVRGGGPAIEWPGFFFVFFLYITRYGFFLKGIRERRLVFGSALLFVYTRATHASHSPPADTFYAHFQGSSMRLLLLFKRARPIFVYNTRKIETTSKTRPATATKHKPQIPQKPCHTLVLRPSATEARPVL